MADICGKVTVRKESGVTLEADTPPSAALLAAVLRGLVKNIDPHLAELIARNVREVVEVVLRKDAIEKFAKLEEDRTFDLELEAGFLALIDSYLGLLQPSDYDRCLRAPKLPPWKIPTEKATTCWQPILTDLTADERLAWAYRTIEAASDDDGYDDELGAGGRYVPGQVYGNILFLAHPYPAFFDVGLWLTRAGDVYLVDERQCRLDAFRAAVLAATGTVILTWGVLGTAAAVAALTAGGILAADLGAAAFNWFLVSPIAASPLLLVGAELTIAVIGGAHSVPSGPGDQLVFMAGMIVPPGAKIAARQLAVKAAEIPVQYVVKVTAAATKGTTTMLKGVVQAARALPKKAIVQVASAGGQAVVTVLTRASGRKTLPKQTQVLLSNETVAALGTIGKSVTDLADAVAQLALRGLKRKDVVLLLTSKDPEVLAAAIKFGGLPLGSGIEPVIAAALKSPSPKNNSTKGALFVLRYALQLTQNVDVTKKAVAFEMTSGPREKVGAVTKLIKGYSRRVDLFLDGVRYELKSGARLADVDIIGRRVGKRQIPVGELERDLTTAFDATSPGSLRDKLRWVFSEEVRKEMVASLQKKGLKHGPTEVKEELARQVVDLLTRRITSPQTGKVTSQQPFAGWKDRAKLEKAIAEIAEFFEGNKPLPPPKP